MSPSTSVCSGNFHLPLTKHHLNRMLQSFGSYSNSVLLAFFHLPLCKHSQPHAERSKTNLIFNFVNEFVLSKKSFQLATQVTLHLQNVVTFNLMLSFSTLFSSTKSIFKHCLKSHSVKMIFRCIFVRFRNNRG